MEAELANTSAWAAYGAYHMTRGTNSPELERITWGFWPDGPAEEVLGDMRDCRIADVGSGLGRHAAYLVRKHGVTIDAIEASATQHERAASRYSGLSGLQFVLADAVDHLRQAEPYDVIYSINAFGYVDPKRLLPAVAAALAPGGRLVFSVLHTNSEGSSPSDTATARPEILPLAGGGQLAVQMWVLATEVWRRLLEAQGLRVEGIDTLDAPDLENPVSCRLFRVRRP